MKANKKHTLMVGLMIALLLAIVGCGGEDAPVGPDGSNGSSFNNVILSGGAFEDVATDTAVVEADTTLQTVGNEAFFCTTTRYSVTEAPEAFPLFDPNAEVIFPGNLLQGNSLEDATPAPIPVRRAGGNIVMTIVNGSRAVSRRLNEINLSSVLDSANSIISTASDTLPARFSFTKEFVQTREQLALSLDIQVSRLGGQVGASLSFSQDKEYNRYVVKLVQSFYTMAYQLPTSKDEIFAPGVTPADLEPYVGPGNPAAFISSVTFGRMFYLLIESTSSRQEMEASLDASFNAAVTSGQLGADAKYIKDLESVKVKAFALGGESSAAIQAITTDFDQLKDFLAKGGSIRTGVPMSYVVRSLANPSQIVNTKLATEYDVNECVEVSSTIANPIFWYRVDDSRFFERGSGSSANRIKKLMNVFGDSDQDAVPPTGTYGCELANGAIAAGTLPAMRFVRNSAITGEFQYPGLKFVNSDYTIFAVVKLENLAMNYPEFFIWGSGVGDGTNLSAGFRDNVRATNTHGGSALNASAPVPLDRFNVITIRFSRTDGMSIYFNNATTPAASDAALTSALTSYLGARFGTKGGGPMQIAEIQAYGTAVSDDQRQAVVSGLLTKYSL